MDVRPLRIVPGNGVRLSELFPRGRILHTNEIRATACTTDYRQCRPGDVFVAAVDAEFDGHDYVHDAIARGAQAVIVERIVDGAFPQCVVSNARLAFGRLCHALADTPSRKLTTIGIAGNFGRRATQLTLSGAMKASGTVPAFYGNADSADGWQTVSHRGQTQTSSQLVNWLGRATSHGCQHGLIELDPEQARREFYAGLQLDMLVLHGLSSPTSPRKVTPPVVHYIRRTLAMLKPNGKVVANFDCAIVRELVGQHDRRNQFPLLTVGTQYRRAEIRGELLDQCVSEQRARVFAGRDTAILRTFPIGTQFLVSSLLATAVGLALGHELTTVLRGIESVHRIPGELELIRSGTDYSLVVDESSTPDEVGRALKTLRQVTDRRLICVVGEGPAELHALRARRGQIAEKYADLCVLTCDQFHTQPLAPLHDMLDGMRRPGLVHLLPNRARAISFGIDQAEPGDTVVIFGPRKGTSVSNLPPSAYPEDLPWIPREQEGQRNLVPHPWALITTAGGRIPLN